MSAYKDLLAQRNALEKQHAELEKQIASAKREERSSVIATIKTMMSDHGLTAEDLGASKIRQPKSGTNPSKKVPAKYRDKQTGQTWSGRGLQPKWLKSALAQGHNLSEFTL
jgi:DNA-binding protein H-NS